MIQGAVVGDHRETPRRQSNTNESTTLKPVLEEVLQRFACVWRIVLVADRGLLSRDNLEGRRRLRVSSAKAKPLEFILSVPGRRYAAFESLLQPLHDEHCANAQAEVCGETKWQELRRVWTHDLVQAAEQTQRRQDSIDELTSQVIEVRLGSIIGVDLQSDEFTWDIDERALQRARLNDGKLLLVTNVQDLQPQDVITRYKSLADIERGLRVLKSNIEIAPVFHRLPDRIRAHAPICFLALVLQRVRRMELKNAGSPYSPQRVLERVKSSQLHQVSIDGPGTASGISELEPVQVELFEAWGLPVPTKLGATAARWQGTARQGQSRGFKPMSISWTEKA